MVGNFHYHKSYAGRRTDFRDKKSSDFSGEIFRERNYCPRTGFSGSDPCSILSHPVMSWYGSRAVGCPLGREITARTCFLLGNDSNEGTPPDFENFFLEKRPWKRFSTNVLIRGKWIHSTVNWWEQSCTPEKSLQKNLSRKIARFCLKNQSCDRRYGHNESWFFTYIGSQ